MSKFIFGLNCYNKVCFSGRHLMKKHVNLCIILNYVYEKELDTQFLLATANHVQDFSIGEITDKKIEKRGEDFYLIS